MPNSAEQFTAVKSQLGASMPSSHLVNDTTAMAILAAADRIATAIEELTTAVKAIENAQ
jgi:hypothetical protein